MHGEENDMTDEEREIIMSSWCKDFHAKIVEADTPPEWIYNTDQIGLYFQNLTNRLFVDEANKKDYNGVKQIKDKTRIAIMVGTSARRKIYTCCSWETKKSRISQTDACRKGTPSIKKIK